MTPRFQGMAVAIRREVMAWVFVGLAAHWAWTHGLDRWTVMFGLAAAGIHPPKMDN